jgi:hypothetical protein
MAAATATLRERMPVRIGILKRASAGVVDRGRHSGRLPSEQQDVIFTIKKVEIGN